MDIAFTIAIIAFVISYLTFAIHISHWLEMRKR